MTTLPEISSTERFDVVTANENFQSVSPAAAFGIDWEETVALTLGVLGGIAPDGTEKADTTVALTGSQTNYVEMTTAGVVSSNTSAYTAGRVKLFRIVTNANGITSYTDDRSYSPGGLSVLGPTSSSDNAVARWDSTTGKRLQDSVVTISDLGAVAGATSLTIAQGTITDPANALTITSTWNDGADTFVGSGIDITDTASASASVIWRARVGGNQVYAVGKTGHLGIGATAPSAVNAISISTSAGSGTTQRGVNNTFTVNSATSAVVGYRCAPVLADSGGDITWASVRHYETATLTKSRSGDTVTEQTGFLAALTNVAALNTGFRGTATASGTALWNCYMSGTAPNYFEGEVTLGTTTLGTAALTFGDAKNIAFHTSTGTKIGTGTTQKIGFWNKAPAVQPSTSTTAATRTGGGGTTVTDTDTFNGYTIARVVGCLQSVGILA